ncbi:MAG TPA: ATP phosphoribosyltransferase regulatory subunit [Isosphaeraceae bacterium]|jgi:histidyl-tRNA synthetase|nr:ATP phosphoribosyltransferase regulatory subunit [Isosphaeraceae bacterium]
MSADPPVPSQERPIGQVRGTRDWLPSDFAALAVLEGRLLDRFAMAGYEPLRTPVLEFTELHERKSGAGIVSKLYEVADGSDQPLCLRPELTASIVRAYTAAEDAPPSPWRVSMAGPVFRHEPRPRAGHYREFHQVGVELLGASGPAFDGEAIWLADSALRAVGIEDATVRIGHVGLILEMLERSGLPAPARSALVEMLSEAAAEGRDVGALEQGLDQLAAWLRTTEGTEIPLPAEGDDPGVDRLFRTLMPVITGRRTGREILGRLRRKWDLGHSLLGVLEGVRTQVHELSSLRGPAADVLDRLDRDFRALAPSSIASLRELLACLEAYGVRADRVTLDLGFGRGIGFYSQMIFEWTVPTPGGPVEVCGGGRYDGLARVLGSDRDDRGVGFAFGLERLLRVLDARGLRPPPWPASGVLVWFSRFDASEAVRLAQAIRATGGRAVLDSTRNADEAVAIARSLGLAAVASWAYPERDLAWVRRLANDTEDFLVGLNDEEIGFLARRDPEGRR